MARSKCGIHEGIRELPCWRCVEQGLAKPKQEQPQRRIAKGGRLYNPASARKPGVSKKLTRKEIAIAKALGKPSRVCPKCQAVVSRETAQRVDEAMTAHIAQHDDDV